MSLGNTLKEIKNKFISNIRSVLNFVNESSNLCRINEKLVKGYQEEFQPIVDYLKSHISEIYSKSIRGDLRKDDLYKVSIVNNMKESLDCQKKYFYRMPHVYFIAIFEAFNQDFFEELFSNMPNLKINITSWNIDYLSRILKNDKNFQIDLCSSLPCWTKLRENFYRRHIIVHKDGVIDGKYISKIGLSSTEINKEIKNDYNYLESCCNNICDYMEFLYNAIIDKFKIPLSKKSLNAGKILSEWNK